MISIQFSIPPPPRHIGAGSTEQGSRCKKKKMFYPLDQFTLKKISTLFSVSVETNSQPSDTFGVGGGGVGANNGAGNMEAIMLLLHRLDEKISRIEFKQEEISNRLSSIENGMEKKLF